MLSVNLVYVMHLQDGDNKYMCKHVQSIDAMHIIIIHYT